MSFYPYGCHVDYNNLKKKRVSYFRLRRRVFPALHNKENMILLSFRRCTFIFPNRPKKVHKISPSSSVFNLNLKPFSFDAVVSGKVLHLQVCVCVCERERERKKGNKKRRTCLLFDSPLLKSLFSCGALIAVSTFFVSHLSFSMHVFCMHVLEGERKRDVGKRDTRF